VNDTTTGATNDDVSLLLVDACEEGLREEEEKVVAKMETIIQFFRDCLQVTGGDSEPSKCPLHSQAPVTQSNALWNLDSVKINGY
jgi:Asp-tRNA(Asn)/Glu-tRNA(Gln) amidotransferase C subunit